MKEILKTKEGKIMGGLAILVGIAATWILAAIWWNWKEKQIQSDMEKFLAGNPDSTAQQLLALYKTAINS